MPFPRRESPRTGSALLLAFAACQCEPDPASNLTPPFVPPNAEQQLVTFAADTLPDWRVQHADGTTTTTRRLYATVRRPLQLLLRADRNCTFAIPAMRVRGTAVPDHFQSVWFVATQVGEFEVHVQCGHERHDGILVVAESKTTTSP